MSFDITKILNAAATGQAGKVLEEDFRPIRLDYEEIKITKHNRYSMDEIADMAAGIEMAGGLQQPLVLGRVNGEWWLASGHRRRAGVEMLVKGGAEKYRVVDCRYKDMTETEFRLHVLIGNTFNRHYTDYDKMIEAEEWKKVLTAAKKEKLLILENGARVRDYVAQILGTSAAVVGDYSRISNNAVPEIKQQFQEGKIGVTAAAQASRLDENEQTQLAGRIEDGEDIKAAEIKEMADKKKEEKEKRSVTEQKTAQMSDTDTSKEEKANARRLHALKMLEKYYIYMSDEEVGILERMLEDCKRRKREYGLEDVGSTT